MERRLAAEEEGMKRTLLAALVVLAAFPAAASADTVEGVVVARDAQRGIVVTADRSGTVAALRVQRAGAFKPGAKLRAKANKLGDGTYRVRKIKRRGRAAAAKARFTVLARADRALVATAGGTTFTLGAGAAAPAPGTVVAARLRLAGGKATVARVKALAQLTRLELTGRFAGFANGVLQIDVGAGILLSVTVPAGVEPALQAGDEVTVLVDGAFNLIAIDGELEVYGALTAIAPDSLSVGAVTCAVPEDLDVSDLVVGDTVLVFCSLVDGVLTAEDLELDEPLDDEPWDEEEGEDELP
jgi:hypothetical protein